MLGDLVARPELALTVVAAGGSLDRPVRWVHTSELVDPTPWLRGGELLLSTGMALGDGEAQGAYVRRLAEAGVAGLGFGVGFSFPAVPAALTRAAEGAGFPVLEVPYPVPFIAIGEAVLQGLADERVRQAEASARLHERLAALVAEGGGPADVLDEVVALAGGWAMLFDLRGRAVATAATQGCRPPSPGSVWGSLPPALAAPRGPIASSDVGPHGAQAGVVVTAGPRREGVLVFGKAPGRAGSVRLGEADRMVVRHAVTVLGLLLASRRAVIDATRRVTGEVLSEGFAGRLTGADLGRRLELVGFGATAKVTAIVLEPDPGGDTPLEEMVWAAEAALGLRCKAVRATAMGGRVAALVAHDDPRALAEALVADLGARDGRGSAPAGPRAGVGETVEPHAIRHSYLGALFALRASPRAAAPQPSGGTRSAVASVSDLGAYGFLLGAQPRFVLESFVRSALGPLIDRDRRESSQLVPSVAAFIEAGGRWDAGASALGVHRHTLRYRIRQAEDILGRDLSSEDDRLELWLALKAADVLSE